MMSSRAIAVVRGAAIVVTVLVCDSRALAQVKPIECPGEVVQISVARLVSDLEKLLPAHPKVPEIPHQLARVHLTAFVERKSNMRACSASLVLTVPAGRGRGIAPFVATGTVWGPEVPVKDDWRPRTPLEDDSREGSRAHDHLQQAIVRYREAIAKTAPTNNRIAGSQWLGYAWALEQSGAPKDQVIAAYRNAARLAWPEEERVNLLPPPPDFRFRKDEWGTFSSPDVLRVTETVARWLVPLLDPSTNQAEIATLQERAAALAKVRKARTK